MAQQVLQLTGSKSDYDLQIVNMDGLVVPVLVGTSAQTGGQLHILQGFTSVQFKDGAVSLLNTALAQHKQKEASAPDNHTSDSFVLEPLENEQLTTVVGNSKFQAGFAVSPSNYANGLNPTPATLPQQTEQPILAGFSVGASANPSTALQSNQAANYITPIKPLSANEFSNETVGQQSNKSLFTTNQDFELNPILGTEGPDTLIGTAGADLIDGARNTQLVDNEFREQLLGMGGDDQLFFRGFFGEFNSDSTITAFISGGDGNDQLHIVLDRTTAIEVDGGSGTNQLTLQASESPFDPWLASFINWGWQFNNGTATLFGAYADPLHTSAKVVELTPSIQWVSSGSSAPLQLLRPQLELDPVLIGTAAADLIIATTNTQTIVAGSGNDLVIAQQNNTVSLGSGINTLYANGSGITLDYTDTPFAVDINLANRIGLVFDDSSNFYAVDRIRGDVANVSGSINNDKIVGNHLDNVLRTHGGQDSLTGGAGADTFIVDITSTTDKASINDFSFDERDSLLINLSNWAPKDVLFSHLIAVNDNGDTLFENSINNEEGALLTVLLSENDHNIQYIGQDNTQVWVQFNNSIANWDSLDWSSALTFDFI